MSAKIFKFFGFATVFMGQISFAQTPAQVKADRIDTNGALTIYHNPRILSPQQTWTFFGSKSQASDDPRPSDKICAVMENDFGDDYIATGYDYGGGTNLVAVYDDVKQEFVFQSPGGRYATVGEVYCLKKNRTAPILADSISQTENGTVITGPKISYYGKVYPLMEAFEFSYVTVCNMYGFQKFIGAKISDQNSPGANVELGIHFWSKTSFDDPSERNLDVYNYGNIKPGYFIALITEITCH